MPALAVAVVTFAAVLCPYVALRWSKTLVHSTWWVRSESRRVHDLDSVSTLPLSAFRPLAEVELALHRLRDP